MLLKITLSCLVLVTCFSPLWSAADVLREYSRYINIETGPGVGIYTFRWFQILVGSIPLVILCRNIVINRTLINDNAVSWQQIRLFIIAIFISLLVTSIAYGFSAFENDPFQLRSFFNTSLFLSLSAWALLLLTSGSHGIFTSIWLRRFEILFFNLTIILFTLEPILAVYSKYSPSPLLWDQSSIVDRIAAHKMKPGANFYDTYINSNGYHDAEFFVAEDSDFVIGMLADSFGVGVVPYDFNFATVAERELQQQLEEEYQRIAIHNFGNPGIGMDEYAYLLDSEVLKYKPDLVMVSVFIGNDLYEPIQKKRNYYALQNWVVGQLPKRIFSIFSENRTSIDHNTGNIGKSAVSGDDVPEHVFDWRKEEPTMSEERFLFNEQRRLEICNPENPVMEDYYQHFFKIVRYFQSALGERVFFVLIPDEFQVNDSLYDKVLETKASPESYIRNYPQQRLSEYFDANKIHYLDLLPALKSKQESGRTYHLQDTHWNARGNKVAGEEIAKFVLDLRQ